MSFVNERQCKQCKKYSKYYIENYWCKCDGTCNLFRVKVNKNGKFYVQPYNKDWSDLRMAITDKSIRMKATEHFTKERQSRLKENEKLLGASYPVDVFWVDKGDLNNYQLHVICSNGLCFVFGEKTRKLITVLILRQARYRFYYTVMKKKWDNIIDYRCFLNEQINLNEI